LGLFKFQIQLEGTTGWTGVTDAASWEEFRAKLKIPKLDKDPLWYNDGTQILDDEEKYTHFLTFVKGMADDRKIVLGKGWSNDSEE
jgi:hypothetical protein